MADKPFKLPLYLPAQGAAETEATLIEWLVSEGDRFAQGQTLAQAESAKSVFDFQAPCNGRLLRLFYREGETVSFFEPVMEVETADEAMKSWTPPVGGQQEAPVEEQVAQHAGLGQTGNVGAVMAGVGGYLPHRVVTNAELVESFSGISEQYVHQVTGIRERRWAADGEKPSDMALAASLEAIRNSGIATKDIGAIILATTTPDMAMPSTACILQDRLNLRPIPAFDLNAACSGWLYAVSMAHAMIVSGMANNVLAVGVDMQSRLLDRHDRKTCFIFGDGAGAAIISAGNTGHHIRQVLIGADVRALHMARRGQPGYVVANGCSGADPWIRVDGHALFRFATESLAAVIRKAVAQTGWKSDELRWIIPHQANGRILRAAAKRSGTPVERFYMNVERVGNTSSASIPLALTELQRDLKPADKLILCSVGAGMTTAAVAVEW
jgi:3-oxoacyl-[acyl-carrier-protein] synthase-3